MKKKKDSTMRAVIIGLAVILLISFNVFLFTKDCAECYTGWQILGMKGVSFWIWAIVLTALAAGVVFLIVRALRASGGVGISLNVLIPVVVFLSIAWGGVCTDKANNGVTTEKYKPTGPMKDNRESAEEQARKADSAYNKKP